MPLPLSLTIHSVSIVNIFSDIYHPPSKHQQCQHFGSDPTPLKYADVILERSFKCWASYAMTNTYCP